MSVSLVRDPLHTTVHCDDPVVCQAVHDSYARFVDFRDDVTSDATSDGVVFECVADRARLDALVRDGKAALRTAGIGATLAQGASLRLPDRTVLVLGDHGGGSLTILRRELRILFVRQFLAAGWLPLHAAGVICSAEGAVLLMGPKMAGKTTTLLRLLQAGATGLVSNDKVFVKAGPGVPAEVRSLPVSISVRGDTLGLFPELCALTARAAELHIDNIDGTGRLFFPLRALADAFGTRIRSAAPVVRIVEVRFSPNRTRSRIRPLDAAELTGLLSKERLDRSARWQENWQPDGHLLAFGADTVIEGLGASPAFSVEIAAGESDFSERLLAGTGLS